MIVSGSRGGLLAAFLVTLLVGFLSAMHNLTEAHFVFSPFPQTKKPRIKTLFRKSPSGASDAARRFALYLVGKNPNLKLK
jgi:hypothetical protein